MRKFTRALVRASLVALAVMPLSAVEAAPITFAGTATATAPGANNAMVLDFQMITSALDFTLDAGKSKTIDLFKLWNTTTAFNNSGVQNESVDVDFLFTSPEAFSGDLTGSVRGDVSKQGTGRNATFVFSGGTVDFSATPLGLLFGPNKDGLLNITLSDATFGTGIGAAGVVQATFSLASLPTAPVVVNPPVAVTPPVENPVQNPTQVPEPGTLGLVGLGLMAVSLRARRRAL